MVSQATSSPTLDRLAGQRVLILGLARQGLAMARFATAVGAEVTISDLRDAAQLQSELNELAGLPRPVETVLGAHPLSLLDDCDLLIVSGSVPLDSRFVQAAVGRGIPLSNDSLEFIRRCPAPTTIGITGSAGKTTTTSLLGLMGELSGRPTWVGGNIGRPLLPDVHQIQANDLVIQELSSFQLDLWDVSPHIAGVLNITPNHLDRHKTMTAYTAAKANIVRHQQPGDVAVLAMDDPAAAALAHRTPAAKIWFGLNRPLAIERGVTLDHGQIVWQENGQVTPILSIHDLRLRGRHNLLNALAACALATAADIPFESQAAAIRQFQGVPHRLELVAEANGVRYINDSIATAPERALAALAAFSEPLVLLAGGRDKDMVWETWAKTVAKRVDEVILFGALAPLLREKLAAAGRTDRVETATDLAEAVALAADHAPAGSIVLLSPGGTSYDSYKDFAERGQHFRDQVKEILGDR